MELIFATLNPHKAREVQAILVNSGVTLRLLSDLPTIGEPPETGDSFVANALQKARYVFEATGLPCVADDSGLQVDALGGAPGVHSKRFSAQATHAANNALLLERLQGVSQRQARFCCVIALVAEGVACSAEGVVEGTIGRALQGSDGFGYDPLFWPLEVPGRTMAQLSMSEKNAISHRGRAFRQLPAMLGRLT